MKDFLFRAYCFNRNGKLNYDRASKFLGYSKSDLIFMMKHDFPHIDYQNLMTGVYVGFHPTSKSPIYFAPWQLQTCYHSQEDLKFMDRLIWEKESEPSWATHEYFIMDADGKILFKTFDLDITQTIDENGVIHLKTPDGNLNEFIYPAELKKYPYKRHFCYGRNLKSLNSHITTLCEKKYINKPKNFKKGFFNTPERPLGEPSNLEKQ